MMELGALICTPKNPNCADCPLARACTALKKNLVQELPRKGTQTKRIKIYEEVSILKRGKKIALMPKGSDPKYPHFMRLPFRSLASPLAEKKTEKIFKYAVTHRDFKVFLSKSPAKFEAQKLKWLDLNQVEQALLPAIDRKILKHCL